MADFTPEPHVFESDRNSRLGWHGATAELIDNSFDAGALRVTVVYAAKSFTVVDDGAGTADIMSIVRLGSHRKHATTSLGMYGVGVINAWMWAGDTIDVATTHHGVTRTIRVSPGDIRQLPDRTWSGPDPVERGAFPAEVGTRITIENLKNRNPSSDQICQALRKTFMPALESGRQILVKCGKKRVPLQPYRLPAMIDSVKDSFEVQGREVSIEIGIVSDSEVLEHSGFLVCYGHRVIKNTTLGVQGYSASRLTGKILLGRGWKLTKNKDDLSDLSEELGDAIFSRIERLCEKAEQLSEDIESDEIRNELETLLNEGINNATCREKRPGSTDDSGTVLPKHTGRRRRSALRVAPTEPGSVSIPPPEVKRKTGVRFDWCQTEAGQIGEFDDTAGMILLNKNNPFIAHIRYPRNTEALYAVAMGIFTHAQVTLDGKQRKLAFEASGFLGGWGHLMNSIRFKEKMNDSDAA